MNPVENFNQEQTTFCSSPRNFIQSQSIPGRAEEIGSQLEGRKERGLLDFSQPIHSR